MFEWDEDKRRLSLKKHGLDFRDAAEIFDTEYLRLPGRNDIEIREIAVGYLNGTYMAVVFTMRDEVIRIITVRRQDAMSEKHMTRMSLDEIRKTKSQTDWDRVKAAPDHEGEQEIDVDWSKASLVEPEPKKLISLRIDADIVEFFRSQGKGYQTRMNAVLRAYKEAMQKSD